MEEFDEFLDNFILYGGIVLFGILLTIVIVCGVGLLLSGLVEILDTAFLTVL